MNKRLIFVTIIIMLFSSNEYSAQKNCSAFTHKIDIKICEARNLESTNQTAGLDSEKVGGFFNNLKKKLNLKDSKKFRQVGDK